MIKQAEIIKMFCEKEGFNFIDCDKENIKVPCSLDRNYKVDNQTIFIKGFFIGSKKITMSYGGLKFVTDLRTPIDEINDESWIRGNLLPSQWICDKCKKRNLNLRTQDNHKTYDCPDCQKNPTRRRKNEMWIL